MERDLYKKLLVLFDNCLTRKYTHVENAGDYCTERIGNTLYLYLAHSDGREDWENNLDFFPIRQTVKLVLSCIPLPKKACPLQRRDVWYAHRGFVRVFGSVRAHLEDTLADKGLQSIVIVGYSHGAALAVLCHDYLVRNRCDIADHIEGYAFGCPRVLWGYCARCVAEKWKNFTVIRNRKDIVTHVPPALLGFRHVGRMLVIGKRSSYSAIDAHRPENIRKELLHLANQTEF